MRLQIPMKQFSKIALWGFENWFMHSRNFDAPTNAQTIILINTHYVF